ncbi:MFS transporter [Solimonas sp. K1W22B-7]|uniref:MFS transporter n=1 Tax=Solimonas sp. K1W22B-7 TaxID=2303331 RepID=UPI000E333BAA|nr:MFS transporter [Solimonas sp. K1W22B-7]AXQ29480.1 MFS transporter [Solimonas sp. K1W22B-7]
MSAHVPAKRLAGFYFWYFAAIGTLVPFTGLFLQERGATPAQIGAIGGILALTRIVSPYLWGHYADRDGRRMAAIRITLGGGMLAFAALQFAPGFAPLALCFFLYGMFNNGTMPQFEAVTFNHLGANADRYGRIRLWGSIGFVVAVLAMGPVFERLGVHSMPLWVAGLFALCWLTGLRIPEAFAPAGEGQAASILGVLRRPAVIALLAACLLSQVSFGPYYNFFSIWLKDHGYSKSVIGFLWAFGVVAEVGIFFVMHRLRRFWSLRSMMLWALAGTSLRWFLQMTFVDNLPWMTVVQALHAVSFGLYHFAAVSLVQQLFPGALQGRGQAIYTGLSYGVGGAIGGFGSGLLWEAMPPDYLWLLSGGVALLAWAIAWRGLKGVEI